MKIHAKFFTSARRHGMSVCDARKHLLTDLVRVLVRRSTYRLQKMLRLDLSGPLFSFSDAGLTDVDRPQFASIYEYVMHNTYIEFKISNFKSCRYPVDNS